jgi:hypothetical protein
MDFTYFVDSLKNDKREPKKMVSLYLLVKMDYPDIKNQINDSLYGDTSCMPELSAGEYVWYEKFLHFLVVNNILLQLNNGFQLIGKYTDYGESKYCAGLQMEAPCIYLDKEKKFFSEIGFNKEE